MEPHPPRKEDFAFSVKVPELPGEWHVFRMVGPNGKAGMMAFRQNPATEQWEIGFMRAGEFTEAQVVSALQEGLQ